MSTALLSSTFWLLLNTPMVPPERKTRSKSVPMVNLGATTTLSHSRRSSVCASGPTFLPDCGAEALHFAADLECRERCHYHYHKR
ncbi:hypothetical protein BD413DRAFT_485180 [Trametes elegans]|nr:hypothetical protein BD413DRAFT_485180 [Trametes elegans]